MEYRKVFDEIPEQFDKYRPRYSAELFTSLREQVRRPIRFWKPAVIITRLNWVSIFTRR